MHPCPHYVFYDPTNHPTATYVHQEFGVELGARPGAYGLEADLIRILNGHFRFVGPVAFAPSESARQAARREVEG